MTTIAEAERWASALEHLVEQLAPRFRRLEARQRALTYLRGLLAPLERKNGWHLAEAAGDRTPDALHDFLGRARWDAEAVRDDLQAYVVEHLGDADAVLVLDETGFLKKGTRSVGVKRQYCGTAGRTENCQVAVFLSYASRRGRALIDRALYLPEEWTADAERRRLAGVPEEVGFATKPKQGRAMLERAVAAGVPCAWVTADSVYGGDYALRLWLERQPIGYVLAVTSKQRAPLGFDTVKERAVARVGACDWQRLSAGDGAKGPRLYDWAYKSYPSLRAGWSRGLLVRRSIAEPDKLTYYLTFAPEGTPLLTLVRIAGTRWTVEACFEAAKGEVGLDQYEVRTWTAWHRHVTLAMFALAFLTVARAAAIGGRGARRSVGRFAAPHRAGNPPPACILDRPAAARTHRRYRLVRLAAPTPATRTPVPLEAPYPNR
ncbi:IS701 family transposase [Azospirillum canadense]|uniref:IS701 family transposase n=1 Tax=Azospirillum canadense TaxID=403962 RepID=UPI0022276159|nr:IS701 family transposase [Azospirillum canadense]MCW2237104.1 SRSO17 transposase [Azospirillum canadense]MCW2239071.1 SRSO17 transposase [Azospirillum canadense]MCW2239103.1 SRSO17 transposase [Azospirillum canadense]MCW2241338.1 SRSO17 transposase [Azospirillum canadense]